MGFGLGDAFSFIANPGQFWGTNDLIGGALNDITGQSSSARQQYQNQLALQKDAQNFAKWQMANSHQQEVADLEAAGLNRVLSANSGASAGVSQGSASAGTPSANPIEMAGAIMNMINSAKQTKATVDQAEATSKQLGEMADQINAITEIIKETGTFPGMPIETSSTTTGGGIGGIFSGTRSTTETGPANRRNRGNQTPKQEIQTSKNKALNQVQAQSARQAGKKPRVWKVYGRE